MGQRSGCFSVQSCQGRSEWPCCHGCPPLHPWSPGCRWVLGSRCGAGLGHRRCLPCHGWAVCCQGALVWLERPTAPLQGAPRPFGQKPAREKGREGQHRARGQRALTYGVRTRTGHCCVPALPFGARKDAESCSGSVNRGQTPLQPRGLRAPCDVWAAQALLLLTQHPALRYTRRRQLWEQKVLLAQTHGEREVWEGTEEG